MVQEALRSARGRHDALNSLLAGAAAGAVVAGHYQGPQFRMLGAALWGPLCCLTHILNDATRPRLLLEDILIGEGLLDPSVRGEGGQGGSAGWEGCCTLRPGQRTYGWGRCCSTPHHAQGDALHFEYLLSETLSVCADRRPAASPLSPAALYRQAARTSSMDDLVDEATRVRDREMHELYHSMTSKGQQPAQQSSSAAGEKASASAKAALSSKQPDQPRPKGTAAGPRDTEEEEEEEFDEADFKRWVASAKAAGGREAPLADEDTWPSGGEEEQQASATSQRSW